MHTRRILICSNEMVLGAAVEQLLTGENDLQVIGIPTEDTSEILEAVERFEPDSVIFAGIHCGNELDPVYEIITHFPGIQLITLSTGDNWLHIYQERKVLLSRHTDLTKIIRSL